MDDRGVLIAGLVHGEAQIADQVGLVVELRAVRQRLHAVVSASRESDADALAGETRGQLGGHGGGRGLEAIVLEAEPDQLEGRGHPGLRGFRPGQRLQDGRPAAQEAGRVSPQMHPYAAAAALASILESISAHAHELEQRDVTRDELVETCARVLYQVITGRSAA